MSDIARAHPEIVEIDLNPVIAHRAGYTIADARVLLDVVWIGLLVARKTPRSVINKLNGEVVRTLKTPEVRERYRQLGAEEFYLKPAEFDAFLVTDTAAMGRIVKAAKIKLQ